MALRDPQSLSLYIHVPFCLGGKCDYCDFYSVPVKQNDPRLSLYVEKLLEDSGALFRRYETAQIVSVYIGGGTPSVLGAGLFGRLLAGLKNHWGNYLPAEITVEANPESADEEFLAAAREGGVTRLSLGVEAFFGPSRRAVNRAGDESLLTKRLALAVKYFPGAFSADLISGFPFQTEKVLLDDVAALLGHKPAHVSLYALTVEPDTPIAARGRVKFPEGDKADDLWLIGRDALEKARYDQYEVSNFCLPGKESLHNLRYWRMENWLGLGPAASGTLINDEAGTGLRFTTAPDIDLWLARKKAEAPPGFEETLDTLTLIKETLLMGFRLTEGPDESLFLRRFRRGIEELIPETIGAWRKRGLFRREKTALNRQGLLLLDPFILDAFRELDDTFIPC